MNKPSEILVVLAPSLHRTPALLRALSLAGKTGATLRLALFDYDRRLERGRRHGFDLDAYLIGRQTKLEQLAAELRREGFNVQTHAAWGRPIEAQILSAALSFRPDMVIKDVRGGRLFPRVFYTPLDWQLLRECPVPLMLVRPNATSLPRHILAAVDPLDEHGQPHELNESVLRTAAALGMQCDASVDVIHAFDFMPLPVDPEMISGWVPDPVVHQELRRAHTDAFYQLGRKFGVTPEHLHMVDGVPERAIADFALEHSVDLVVMGSLQHHAFDWLTLGSVAEGLLDTLNCDVLALKPEGFFGYMAAKFEQGRAEAA